MQLTRWLIVSIAASLLVLAACSDDVDTNGATDTPAATASASPFEVLSRLTGNWSGAWRNDTFGSSAPITIRIAVNGDGTATFGIDLPAGDSGRPFGIIATGQQAFDGTYDENGLSAILRGDGLFGDLNVTISLAGELVAEATMTGVLDVDHLTVEGTFTGDGLDVTYTVSLSDGSDATGSATLTRS